MVALIVLPLCRDHQRRTPAFTAAAHVTASHASCTVTVSVSSFNIGSVGLRVNPSLMVMRPTTKMRRASDYTTNRTRPVVATSFGNRRKYRCGAGNAAGARPAVHSRWEEEEQERGSNLTTTSKRPYRVGTLRKSWYMASRRGCCCWFFRDKLRPRAGRQVLPSPTRPPCRGWTYYESPVRCRGWRPGVRYTG